MSNWDWLLLVVFAVWIVWLVLESRKKRANRKTGCVCGIADHPAHSRVDYHAARFPATADYEPLPTFTDDVGFTLSSDSPVSISGDISTDPVIFSGFGGVDSGGGGASASWDAPAPDASSGCDSSSDSGCSSDSGGVDSSSSDSGSFESGSSSGVSS